MPQISGAYPTSQHKIPTVSVLHAILSVHKLMYQRGVFMQHRRVLTTALLLSCFIMSMTGCRLIGNIFGLGFGSDDYFYGMTEAEGTLYLSSLEQDRIVDIAGKEKFATFEKPHGLEFDGTYFWVADPNENKIHKYTNSGAKSNEFGLGADPVNILHATVNSTDRLFVADREENNIFGFEIDDNGDIIQDEADANNTTGSIIEIELDSYLNSKAIGSMDMAFDDSSNTLYVVSDEYAGLITVDLSTESSPVVGGTTYVKHSGDFGGLGVALDDGLVYINTGNRILTFDGKDWVDLEVDLREDGGHDYNGYYIDLVVSSTDFTTDPTTRSKLPTERYLYVASGISPEEEVDDDVPHHVIVYSHDGSDWTLHKTVDFDF